MVINSRSLFAAAAAILLVPVLAGCAPASSSSSGGASTPPPAPSDAPSAAAGGSAALTALPTDCPSGTLVSSDLGISTSLVTHSGDSTSLNCTYAGSGFGLADTVSINYSTARKLSPADAEAQTKAQGFTSAFTKVKGVGDFALYDKVPSGGSYIIVGSGPVAFHVVATGTETMQQLETLAKAML